MRPLAATVLLLALILIAAPAAAQIPPDSRWRTFETEHFRVTFPEALEPTARRAADRAERAHAVLSRELVDPPRGRIELVISDNIDLSNGYATPIPTNRIVVYAHPPVSEPSLYYYDDWLHLVLLHELVHIFHLDDAGGVWKALRSVFGRSPALFPQILTPGWLVEGLATAYESRLTAGGRVRGTVYEMMLRTAALEGELFAIDRASADPVRWPAGTTRYLYGGFFVDHLVRTYGPERVSSFIHEYGGRLVPYRLDSAAREAFGTSFTQTWAAWADSLSGRYAAQADTLRGQGVTEPEMLTRHGRGAFHPRFSPAGDAIAYAAVTGIDEPAVRVIGSDGRELASMRATSISPSAWLPGGARLVTSRLDFVDPYRIYADLRLIGLDGGGETITRAARLSEPDVHPDGGRVVAVVDAGGTNALAVHDIPTGETRVLTSPDLDVQWALPRWSPDGELIAAARWSEGGIYDVVLVDTAGTVVRELTRDRSIDTAPAWSPDGRYVVFSSDRTGIPNLHAFDRSDGTVRQVTNLLTGASHPDVSPDGEWIVFSVYGVEGWDIGRIPFAPSSWIDQEGEREAAAPDGAGRGADSVAGDDPERDPVGGPVRRYSPFPSVLPAAWSLSLAGGDELGIGVGASAFGRDVVERHAWAAEALVYPRDGRVAAGASYRYSGLGTPVLDLAATQAWGVRFAAGQVVVGEDTISSAVLERERSVGAGVGWERRRWGSSSWLETHVRLSELDLAWRDPGAAAGLELVDFPRDAGLSVVAGYTSARSYGVSISPQDGFALSGRAEGHRYLEPLAGEREARGYVRVTGRGRGYLALPLGGFARHVLALRADAGVETGSLSPGFGVGGASGGGSTLPLQLDLLGGGLGFPVRGYPAGSQHGDRAFAASAEYRFPITLVERGLGLLPLSLGRVWGDLFADAGSAWCGSASGAGFATPCLSRIGRGDAPDPLYSVGAELVLHARIGFLAELPVRIGAALPLRRGVRGAGPSVHVRVGRSF